MAQTIDKPRIMIVEGKSEEMFFGRLLGHMSLSNIQVWSAEGKDNIASVLKLLPKSPNYEVVTGIAVIRDADDDAQAAFRSVQSAFTRAGLPTPQKSAEFINANPKVGVMILPGQDRPGMLEDLCLESIGADPAVACIDGFIGCLDTNLPPRNRSKARMHAFLASRPDPDQALWFATWDWNHAAFEAIRVFLNELAR